MSHPLGSLNPAKPLDANRPDETEDYWWEFYQDDFAQYLTTQGIDVEPGLPGLMFDIDQRVLEYPCAVSDWQQFLTHFEASEQFPSVMGYHAEGDGNNIKAYYDPHYHRVEIDTTGVTFELRDPRLMDEIKGLEAFVLEVFKDRFQELLETLTDEYEALIADEENE